MFAVEFEAFEPGFEDAHGNTVDAWALPVERTARGWAPTSSHEPKIVGKDRVVVDVEMFTDWPAGHRDRVTFGGRRYLVVGESEDWNHGPFGFAPGHVINLRRVDG